MSSHHTLVHSFVFSIDARYDQCIAQSCRLWQLSTIFIPCDMLQTSRHTIVGDYTSKFGRSAHMNAQHIRHDVHLQWRRDRQPQFSACLTARIRCRTFVCASIFGSDRLNGQHWSQKTNARSIDDRKRFDARVQEPSAIKEETKSEIERKEKREMSAIPIECKSGQEKEGASG